MGITRLSLGVGARYSAQLFIAFKGKFSGNLKIGKSGLIMLNGLAKKEYFLKKKLKNKEYLDRYKEKQVNKFIERKEEQKTS
jgi:hypothetical protein